MADYSDNDLDNHLGDTIGPNYHLGDTIGPDNHLGDTIGPDQTGMYHSADSTVVYPEDTLTNSSPEDTLTSMGLTDDTLTRTAPAVGATHELHYGSAETTIGGQPGSSSIFDTARLAGGVLLGQKKRVVTLTRNLFLITSGIILGVGIALTASFNADPVANASQFEIQKVISVAVQNPVSVEDGGLVVEERLKELEQWFEQQPVPVEERVFLHRAKESLKTRSVDFQAPVAVSSRFSNANNAPINEKVKGKDGRYIADPQAGIEWQGDFEVSNPSKNAMKATKYLDELNENFGLASDAPLQQVTKKSHGSLLKGAEQRSFGPKLK